MVKVRYFCETMDGQGFKSVETFADPYLDPSRGTPKPRKRWYVRNLDGDWYTTNNRDWEPEYKIANHKIVII